MAPLATVVIPIHDGERFLADALRSVADQALDLEVIVIDDGSTDASAAIAVGHGVICLRQAQAGPAAARNAGIAAATAPLVAFLDCDDLIPPGALLRQIEHLTQDPAIDGVLGMQSYEVLDGVALPAWAVADRVGEPGEVSRPSVFAGVFRRELFERVGPFDPDLRLSEDLDWLMRANEAGATIEVRDDVGRVRRIHGGNLTYDTDGLRRSMLDALGRRVRRKRAVS
ncbi:glycosyltransferase family A protein [Aquihabitans sp. McL0605]|uniref:glycosyltransferase family A protein n=1 Tax=Aquihabitans sp. McL0605 TaxID=3415671 RepID=UPI003CEE48DC